MLRGLTIKGFKSIGVDGLDIPLERLTFLLGENSVGKSSVLHMMLGLQQTWQTFEGIASYRPVGPTVDLGRYHSLVHRQGDFVAATTEVVLQLHDEKKVTFEWHDPSAQTVAEETMVASEPTGWPGAWRYYGSSNLGTLATLKVGGVDFKVSRDNHQGPVELTLSAESIEAWLAQNPSELLSQWFRAGGLFRWRLSDADESIEPQLEQVGDGFQGDLEAVRNLEVLRHATAQLSRLGPLRRVLQRVAHIGGVRDRGKRIYTVRTNDAPWSVGADGARICDLLVEHPEAIELTNKLLEEAGVQYRIHLESPDTMADIREIVLTDLRDGPGQGNQVGVLDVGTGISQLLPVAVQIAVLSNSAKFDFEPIILIEQPELHLHPRLQANFARMLAKAITGDHSSRSPQFIIETHSEHLVRAVSVLVEKGELVSDTVALVQLYRNEDGLTQSSQIRLSSDGRFLDEWPSGFFPERATLLQGEIPEVG